MWSPEEVETVQSLLNQGYSAALIAVKMKRTRNAVLGIIHRRNLIRATAPTIMRPGAPRSTKIAAPRPFPEPPNFKRPKLLKAMIRDLPSPQPLSAVRYNSTCAYPVSGQGADSLYCCAETKGEMYCSLHRQIMFQVVSKRQ